MSKKGGQEGNKADWREKRGTEGEMRPMKRAMRERALKGRKRPKRGRMKKERGGGGEGEDEGKKKGGREKSQ